MTKEKFDEIVSEAWDACNKASGEGLGVSATSMEYEYYKTADETEVWNDTVSDFKEAILSHREREDDFDYEQEFALLSDILSDVTK